MKIVYELRQDYEFKILPLLEIAELAKSTYYDGVKRFDRVDNDKFLKDKIIAVYNENLGRYGYRRLTIALNKDIDVIETYGNINHKRVQRLMKVLGLRAKIRVKKYRSYKGKEGVIAPNILDRDFNSHKPEEKMVTDVTEFRVCNKKIYLSPLIDLNTSEVVSYSVSTSPSVSFVMEMMEKGLTKKQYDNLTIHTDQGFQYQNNRYQNFLGYKGIKQSMSRKGNCFDNAKAENFFSQLKAEFFHINQFKSIEEFKLGLDKYINYYNNKRIVTKLKMAPVEYKYHQLANI
ncbi:IS3 family transposase [Mycoplasmatota bacterium zrk1]